MGRPITSAMTYLPGTGWVDPPTDVQPALTGRLTCDVAIVGGGLGGMSAALRMAQLGLDVVLIESGICGMAASGRNAGYVGNSMGSIPWVLERFYGDRVPDLMRFANTAVSFTEGLIETYGIACHYEKTGMLVTATTAQQLKTLQAAIKPGGRSKVLTSEEMGAPPAFLGGISVTRGGQLNPGEFSLGLCARVLEAGVRVFERSPVLDVQDRGGWVDVELAEGSVRAQRALLTVNAFMGTLAIAPRRLSKAVRATAVETEAIDSARLDDAGWTSRRPIITSHLVLEGYRVTHRGTVLMSTRQLQAPRGRIGDRQPDQAVVADLLTAFRLRFPTLHDVEPAQAWGGWIGMTPSNLPVVGKASDRVFYAMACNGHGLPQAPYVGHMLAEHVGGEEMADDLRAVWREDNRFAPGVVNAASLKLAWAADRVLDRWDGMRSGR